jgi:hypothetical protein
VLRFLLTRASGTLSFAGGLLACGSMHLVLSHYRIAAQKLSPEPANG